MAFESYIQVTGTIRTITPRDDCCSQLVSLTTNEGIINMVVSANTRVVDNVQLRRGMRVAAFYDANLPVPAIFPPQYQAEIITSLRRDQEVMLNFFDQDLLAEDQSLRLNIGPTTSIMTLNGQRYMCDLGNSELLVYYTITTMSLPPQTTPQRVIVLCTV